MKYYLYRHIRLDKNEPFYIGIGKKISNYKTWEKEFRRAFSVYNRNRIWKGIVSRTDYKVEILFESDDCNFVKQKEIEFIKLYGRIDISNGSLANLTDGGDGNFNRVISEETKKKIADSNRGRIVSKETKDKMKISNIVSGGQKEVYCFDTEFNIIYTFNSSVKCAEFLKSRDNVVSKSCRENSYFKGYFLTYDKDCKTFIFKKYRRPILQINKEGYLVKEWKDSSDIRSNSKLYSNKIWDVLNGERKSHKGYIWKYKFKELYVNN